MDKKDEKMERLATEIVSGMKEWRVQNPKATFAEIERETMKRMAALQAQLMAEIAQESEAQEWDATSDDWWILVLSEDSTGDDTVTLRVGANSTGSPRQGTVTFSSDDCDDVVVTVNQLANPV